MRRRHAIRHEVHHANHHAAHRALHQPAAARPLRSQLSQLSNAAANIAAALLADWFRMDLFLGHPLLALRVNEITYPSHILDTGALQQWLRKYRELQVRAISGVAVYKRVSETIGLDNNTFWDADGAALKYFEATGTDGRTHYIMAYTRDEAWATAKDLFKLPATAKENREAHHLS